VGTLETDHFIFLYTPAMAGQVEELAEFCERAYAFVKQWGEFTRKEKMGLHVMGEPVPKELRGLFNYSTSDPSVKLSDLPFSFYLFIVHEVMHSVQMQNNWVSVSWIREGFAHYAAFLAADRDWEKFAGFDVHGLNDKKAVLAKIQELGLKPITSPEGLKPFEPWQIEDKYIHKAEPPEFSEEEREAIDTGYKVVYGGGMWIFLFMEEKFGQEKVREFVQAHAYRSAFKQVFGMDAAEFEAQWFAWMAE
jgi:hypothetical protein